jgi:hypothetical protein
MSIKKDLKDGDIGEKIVSKIFEKAKYWAIKNNDTDIRQDYDLLIGSLTQKFTIEVKYDIYSEKSGNIAIEYHNSRQNKPSGIMATKADFWVQVTPNQGSWITTVAKLKQYIKDNKPFRTITDAGDGNANLFLYKADKILSDIFIRIDKLSALELEKTILSMLNFGV